MADETIERQTRRIKELEAEVISLRLDLQSLHIQASKTAQAYLKLRQTQLCISEWYSRAEGYTIDGERTKGIGDHRLTVDGHFGAKAVLKRLRKFFDNGGE